MTGVRVADLLRPAAGPWVIAHRGASRTAPENTMPAFQAAWECGAPWIEADVQPTRDNVPVLLHDDLLDRTTNGSGPVRSRTAYEVGELDAGSWFTTGSTRAYTRTPIPLLADVVGTLDPQRSLLLEIKGEHTRDQVLAEMAVVRASGWDDRVLFESFEVPALRHVRSIEPGRPVGLLVEELHDDPVAVCRELGAVTYNPEHTLLRARPQVVAALHEAKIAVYVWTADHPDDWEFLTDLGVDGIITNTPGELISWQQNRT
ncbi:glycerophosphoryl diester phosphodiesterase [Nakamurella panacisegetis]|uniref:Glycerophosphoryl diester phosphodiesterase n=1 Tax=Nakamurella panacisegetis TaxID=1090615 RepID=A0A1H0QGZ7_9ACTN|nr:glycerophosphodiester phosphodiesterase family protein [Nakamurella panacisegetis]SDP16612.1 glycerophosphoryl diester phosphodiesterase [Nakamurella panacisegetis]